MYDWTFGTAPTTGLYVQVTQTDDGSLGHLTLTVSGALDLIGGCGSESALNGAVIVGWHDECGGGASDVSSVTGAEQGPRRRRHVGKPRGYAESGTFGPVTPLRALRFQLSLPEPEN